MALANKYKTTYCDVYGRTCEVFILQEGFVGSVTELEAQPTPFTITYDSGGDFKFEPIRSSKASLNLILGNGVELSEFWTQNEKEYQIAHYIDSTLDWIGWVIPNGFSYQLTGGVYEAEIEATDGLETLDAKPFLNDGTGNPYGVDNISPYHTNEHFEFILILTECLKKIGLGLDIWVCVDLYEQTMTTNVDSRLGCPLSQATVNVRTYIGDSDEDDIPYWRNKDEVFNTLEVLENLAYMFGAKVYQSQGVWRFQRINANVDYGTGATQRYWYKFNESAVYIPSRVAINDLDVIPCLDIPTKTAMIEDDHYLTMDEVYKRFRVNYKYTYARLGDSSVNLIENGGFTEDWDNVTPESAPYKWERWRIWNKWRPKIEQVSIPSGEQGSVDFNTDAIQFGSQPVGFDFSNTDPYASIWAGLRYGRPHPLNQGDELYLRFFAKFKPRIGYSGVAFMVNFRFITTDGTIYLGSNDVGYELEKRDTVVWYESDADDFLFMPGSIQRCEITAYNQFLNGTRNPDNYQWIPFAFKLGALPGNGTLYTTFHGLASTKNTDTDNFPAFKTMFSRDGALERTPFWRVARNWDANLIRPQLTGVSLQIVPNLADREKLSYYVYDNADQSYSLQKKPIEVLHGDTKQKFTISGITVPTQTNPDIPNLWDVIDDGFGKSSLGLLQAKSIMQLYSKPNKILEGVIQVQDAQIDTAFQFDAIGTERFILQRGQFDRKRGYITNAVFIEVSNELIVEDDGSENGLNNNPIWVAVLTNTTRGQRCVQSGGTNTGEVEEYQQDINPNSPTYLDTRWNATGITDTALCPIGSNELFYWGQNTLTTIPESKLNATTWTEDPDTPGVYWIFGYNRGLDEDQIPTIVWALNYVFLVHLPTLGTVDLVTTSPQPDITEDWGYLSDMTVGGVTYKVYRMNYQTTKFKLEIGFKFI